MPDIPTLQELGYKDFNMSSEVSLLAPKGTPKDIVIRLNAALNKSLQSPEIRERLASLGGEPEGGPPEHLAARVRSDLERWGKVIRDANVTP
jgi:tripartite-type tricarboxylate transporter receptor subunit TctC